jgi:enoyl-CoA hydratase
MPDRYDSTFFALSIDGGVAHLEMNRGDKANAMSPEFWADLPRLAAELGKDPSVRVVVLSGRGKHFSGGIDLAAFQNILGLTGAEPGRGAEALYELIRRLQASLTSLEELRVPVIAAIHGVCLGGGVDLACACDIRLASLEAGFGVEEFEIGMAADVGTLQRLPRLMPPGIVRELAYTGRRFTADEARGWGFVNAVHESPAATLAAALTLAREIAAKSPLAIVGIKRAITYARDHSVADSLEQIALWNAGALRPEDLMKAMQARMSKQKAEFADLLPPAKL